MDKNILLDIYLYCFLYIYYDILFLKFLLVYL